MIQVIKLQCPNCSANLEVNHGIDFCYCTYCGTKILLQDDNPNALHDRIEKMSVENDRIWAESSRLQAEAEKMNAKKVRSYKEYILRKKIEEREQKELRRIAKEKELQHKREEGTAVIAPALLSCANAIIFIIAIGHYKNLPMAMSITIQTLLMWAGYHLVYHQYHDVAGTILYAISLCIYVYIVYLIACLQSLT